MTAFSDFSWLQFVALNWPAGAQRGVPDCTAAFGSSEKTVWQTYKTTDQLFLPNALDPGPWDAGAVMLFTLEHRAKAPADLPVEESVRQAVGGWLTDQHGNPTYYSISVNRVSYEYVVTNGYYNADIIAAADKVSFPEGALEVKAAWRILVDSDDHSRYHTMTAQVTEYDSEGNNTGRTREAVVGMVGMHVVYRAPGFPQWTWATFEQVDNTDASHGVQPSYFNENCSGPHCTPNVSPLITGAPFTAPNQVTRVTDLDDEVIAVNQDWQARVEGTPFQYYRLISPQWPTDPSDPGNPQGSPFPSTVANTVLESYIQPISSCMDCHSTARVPGNATKSNYSFIFLFAQQPAKAQGESQ
ncbi:hypothetical protein [Gilvimarinus polysaccharolyticus]|uniref:hypothetical protein n=1 Tax=Gilvimarinus polysaccharolyticus TaxID=863921 RepID=UPI0012F82ED0|nr:hypothetical protein [Gilvimarinus polysaccharolyticus]